MPAQKATAEQNLHPRAGWLVGFGTEEDPEQLHMPYLQATMFLTDLPVPSAERAVKYGTASTAEERREWPIERLLFCLGETRGPYLRVCPSDTAAPSSETAPAQASVARHTLHGDDFAADALNTD